MKMILIGTLLAGSAFASYGQESKVSIVGDTVISRDAGVAESRGNLEVEGSLTVGSGAVKIEPNGDVVITGRVIIKNPDGGISMGAYGRPQESAGKE